MSTHEKKYGRVLISRVAESTKEYVAEEQGGFRSGGGFADQMFLLKQLVQKYREKKKMDAAFMDLEKAYD